MNPDSGLLNVCVAVGPADATKIRTEYLRDNDNYVEQSLRRLRMRIPNMVLCSARMYFRWQHVLNKCRDDIMAWMAINQQWKGRCTPEKMKKFEGRPLLEEADLVFNNPAVALEIGLLDVF